MTKLVFRDDPYAKSCQATVVAVTPEGVELDCTVFYPTGGGQPGDSGRLSIAGGDVVIANAVKGAGPDGVLHVPAEGASTQGLQPGAIVEAVIDWERRYRLMRMHTCLHLLSAVLSFPVTGGSVGDGRGRLDLDIPEAILDKGEVTARLNQLIGEGHPVSAEWIDETSLAAEPELVKTMAVKPPAGAGRVRLIRVQDLDLQACGGTHVANTREIGAVAVRKIEKKGRHNRRVNLELK